MLIPFDTLAPLVLILGGLAVMLRLTRPGAIFSLLGRYLGLALLLPCLVAAIGWPLRLLLPIASLLIALGLFGRLLGLFIGRGAADQFIGTLAFVLLRFLFRSQRG